MVEVLTGFQQALKNGGFQECLISSRIIFGRELLALASVGSAVRHGYLRRQSGEAVQQENVLGESAQRTTYPTAEQVDRRVSQTDPMSGWMIRFLAETGVR